MPVSEAKKRANKKWDTVNTKRISVVLNNDSPINICAVKQAACASNLSVNAYIREAIKDKIEREGDMQW
jgi:predicted HicB family RNase H-like nuclease